jgi:hypothetical protein
VLGWVERWPLNTFGGAAALAFTAAKMIVDEPLLDPVFDPNALLRAATYALLVAGVIACGWWAGRSRNAV